MNKKRSKLKILTLLSCFIVFLCLCSVSILISVQLIFFTRPFEVSGRSMEETYQDGDIVVGIKTNSYKRGDVVIYHSKNNEKFLMIHRVIAIPGDNIKFENEKLYINGKEEEGSYVNGKTTPGYKFEEGEEYDLKENEYLILGDNRISSKDSRTDGLSSKEDILYLVVVKI